ncbi:hypothetical protein ABNM12_00940 [Pseudomonas syringae]|nr:MULTISPECIES: hypothetical protein [Pseudomonas]EGH74743.1 hypothetical protein PSYAR_29792 [Pseudomonas syringae pv. aceris str. M302273]KWS28649.1 hypothetical protein AL062_06215 [Pseudomonas syringae pv. syringae]MDY2562048.1 hypothetical protein [Pseudomonas syringae]QGG76097.1 hypothetical protein N028_12290 [Pseudomonas syringae USA011]RXT63652.1 hypothetical protein B1F74_13845 [Pseudomonas syringae]
MSNLSSYFYATLDLCDDSAYETKYTPLDFSYVYLKSTGEGVGNGTGNVYAEEFVAETQGWLCANSAAKTPVTFQFLYYADKKHYEITPTTGTFKPGYYLANTKNMVGEDGGSVGAYRAGSTDTDRIQHLILPGADPSTNIEPVNIINGTEIEIAWSTKYGVRYWHAKTKTQLVNSNEWWCYIGVSKSIRSRIRINLKDKAN